VNYILLILSFLIAGCSFKNVEQLTLVAISSVSTTTTTVTTTTTTTTVGGNLLYSDTFPVDGVLVAPWGVTIAANPLPTITGGVATANQVVSTVISTITSTDAYSEVDFNISSAPAPQGDNFYLVHRNASSSTSAFGCILRVGNNVWNVRLWGIINGVQTFTGITPTVISEMDLTQHKLGCSVQTVGADVVINSYIDPVSSVAPILATYTFIGAAATVPQGTSGFVIVDTTDNVRLDNYKLYSTIPY
jgi:hypothetical protein